MLAEYLPTLLFLIVASGIGVALLVVGNVLGPKRPTAEKLSPYECGFEAFEDARMNCRWCSSAYARPTPAAPRCTR